MERVKIGQAYENVIKEKDGPRDFTEKKEIWIVKEIYTYHVVCQNGSRTESFTYFDLQNMRKVRR